MNAHKTIERVREELSEAANQAKDKEYKLAYDALFWATTLMKNYIRDTRPPNFGFKEKKP